ncbi:proton-conducting transporter membrane subunit [Tateyamaria sp. syn59]|uniref:proton-conducting transporter transmembrane domain-containing protein n=1 Tax=Tateyamaria sp. syn59 TaxID=2576942 RepID=UPI0011BF0939|nr:proton-conducting transporter membrane subunit [Tateyamaria sp. syn59]
MTSLPLLSAPAIPVLVALLAMLPLSRQALPYATVLAPLPALVLALSGASEHAQEIPALLLGTQLEWDTLRAGFLLFTSLLWTTAAWCAAVSLHSDVQRSRFCVLFLLAMAGNFGLILAGDIVSFYTFFSMMSLASWGLVAHDRSPFASFAGRCYITFAIVGELALFSGLTLASYTAGSLLLADVQQTELGGLSMILLAIGFGIKLGVVPLHIWLPVAHAAAPAPASAVLSGAMVKAGLFGALVILPLGMMQMPDAGIVVIVLGGVSVVLAALIGVTQNNPKAVLAYSTVAQMGLVAMALGTGLARPETWDAVAPALALFAAHHAFAKAALFLGVPAIGSLSRGVTRGIAIALLALPAVTLAAAPWTSGTVAKSALKDAMLDPTGLWGGALDPALFISSVGTALLMLRFLWLMAAGTGHTARPSAWVCAPWGTMTGLAMGGIWLAPFAAPELPVDALSNATPILIALGLTLGILLLVRTFGIETREVPAGEVLALFRIGARKHMRAAPRVTQIQWFDGLPEWSFWKWSGPDYSAYSAIAVLAILVAIIAAGVISLPAV